MTPATNPVSFDALEDERPLDVDNPADRALYVAELHKVEGIKAMLNKWLSLAGGACKSLI